MVSRQGFAKIKAEKIREVLELRQRKEERDAEEVLGKGRRGPELEGLEGLVCSSGQTVLNSRRGLGLDLEDLLMGTVEESLSSCCNS